MVLKFDWTQLVGWVASTSSSAIGSVRRVVLVMVADLRLNLGQNDDTCLLLLRQKSLTH